jgi:phosphoribosylanthranilate isomerase
MTLIKICGLTSVDDAVQVARLDIQVIGLVFAHSQRQVSVEQAEAISNAVRGVAGTPAIAGVFVNEDVEKLNEIVRRCRLDIVQLSGDESYDYCRQINSPLIKAIHISPDSRSADIIEHVDATGNIRKPELYLLDTKKEGAYGGTGQSFNWEIARHTVRALPTIVAGGLDPQNVAKLINQVRPVGVDVSSGVETSGRKDISKISAFIEAVRSADGPAAAGGNDLLNKYILKGELNVT